MDVFNIEMWGGGREGGKGEHLEYFKNNRNYPI